MTIDELYTVPPREFIAARDVAVAAAKAAGDSAAAAELGKLRRPTQAAWLVNLLAQRRPELLDELVEVAAELRAAQRDLDGARLRELTTRRRGTVSALVSAAASLARDVDPGTARAKLPLAEVEAMLSAALTDPAVAEAVRTGRLVRPLEPAGFGELPPVRLRLVPGGAPDAPAGEGGALVDEAAVAAELAAARGASEAAAAAQERASAAQQAAKQALAALDAEQAELDARRAEAQRRLAEAEAAGLAARREVAAARRRLGEAEALSPPG